MLPVFFMVIGNHSLSIGAIKIICYILNTVPASNLQAKGKEIRRVRSLLMHGGTTTTPSSDPPILIR